MSARGFDRHEFVDAVGSTFEVGPGVGTGSDGASVTMVLDRVEGGPAVPGTEQYAAYFRGPGDPVLGQRSYRLAHPVIGTLELFLVPVGRVGHQVEYEACFNYPVDVD